MAAEFNALNTHHVLLPTTLVTPKPYSMMLYHVHEMTQTGIPGI
jgi:hypothetical protein